MMVIAVLSDICFSNVVRFLVALRGVVSDVAESFVAFFIFKRSSSEARKKVRKLDILFKDEQERPKNSVNLIQDIS